jgi:hypothetical protein
MQINTVAAFVFLVASINVTNYGPNQIIQKAIAASLFVPICWNEIDVEI